ncbi:methionyl-tRNA formyltransferase [Sphingobacterium griseoflavum]|uniref:Methionyl-tRNA formyltransferase n=1 Tax=Sphingobacterium griseoflavum TaxID=1474952 RepID=A0ABQ3HTJ0_9SPHI|nr:methionyl-tRNA formyltransferase [Sphingobacterium griseoflavum]GHE33404.1 methionyl-tRNA formyltransferase [Sphingobacterium griseoflavum]
MRIVFMGTPDFAVASLQALLEAGEHVVAVVTAVDKPAGRGQKVQESAVKKFAAANDIPVLQPEKLRSTDFLTQLASYKADLQVVVAFRMLPEAVWNMPPKGTINVHASLLPQYRGAAPINHAIINGEKESGVTTFLLQHEIDTGNILFSKKVNISPDDNAGTLHDKLMLAGASLLLETVQALKKDVINPIPQTNISVADLKVAPKIFKEDCEIDWNNSTDIVYNHIRGLSPYPTAFTQLNGKGLKIFAAQKGPKIDKAAGEYETDGKTFLRFATLDGTIQLITLQLEGKKKMDVIEFLRGYRFD